MLGARAGVTSGSALLVDYVLTITTSLAAAGDAIFSFLPPSFATIKLPVEIGFVIMLTILNIRGVRESVLILTPIFLVFLVTHALLIGGGIIGHTGDAGALTTEVRHGYDSGVSLLGVGGLLLLFVRAYSLGGGTYPGIEAVSNVGCRSCASHACRPHKRTMLYMALSLAITASGLLLCYLLWHVVPEQGKTMNDVLAEKMTRGIPGGGIFTVITLLSEGALLVVAAQTGFLDGPRVLANMAIDSWVPHRFSALFRTAHDIVTASCSWRIASLAVALIYTGGHVDQLIVMYSINVFLTFSLSMFAMLRFWWRERHRPEWIGRVVLFAVGLTLCATVLVITVFEKFLQGGWVTVAVTTLLIAVCFGIRRHYDHADSRMRQLYDELGDLPKSTAPMTGEGPAQSSPVAAILVGSFGGVGIHTMLNIWRAFPRVLPGRRVHRCRRGRLR